MIRDTEALGWLTGTQLAARIAANHAELVAREAEVLQLACAWADLHAIDSKHRDYAPLVERACT